MWFTADLFFKAIHVDRPDPAEVWEERLLLIEAENETDARELAERIGRASEHEYYVSKSGNDLLRWVFVEVHKIHVIENEQLQSGTELFSRFLRQSDVDSLMKPFDDQ